MATAEKALEHLRAEIARLGDSADHPNAVERLDFSAHGDAFHVFFFGSPFGRSYELVMEALSSEPIANSLISISIDGPNEGSNGTRNWNICPLADSPITYPKLRYLRIAQTSPADHNRTIVAESYEEDGVIGRLAAKSPMLKALVSPSAPSSNFFDVPLGELTTLDIDAGLDAHGFIGHLTKSPLPTLRFLTWGEYAETYMDDWIDHTTPFSGMVSLFQSSAFDSIRMFVLKNPMYSDQELQQLAGLRPRLTFKVVNIKRLL